MNARLALSAALVLLEFGPSRGASDVIRRSGLRRLDIRVLALTADLPRSSEKAIAREAELSKAATARSFARLVRAGLVQAGPDPADGRIRRHAATERGAALLAELQTALVGDLQVALGTKLAK